MAGKFDIKDAGVIYLDEVPQGNFPTEQASTGILGWDGSNLVVKSYLQGPVYTAVPSYKVATGTLALDNSGTIYTAVYNKNIGSMEINDPNTNTAVLVPNYDISTGELVLRDSNGTNYTPRTSVAAQNVAIIGSANVNLATSCVGGIYLEAGSQIQPTSAAYMDGSGASGNGQILICTSNVAPPGGIVASFTLFLSQNMPAGRIAVNSDVPSAITVQNSGWYDILLVLNVGQDLTATVDVFGLRLVVT